MSFTPSPSPLTVAPDPTAQTNDPIVLMFNALYSLLQVFNLESLIRLPGQSNPDASTPGWSLLKILVIGFVAEFARRNAQDFLVYLTEQFFITVSFHERDPCYEWILVWLSKQPNWKTVRTASISTVVNGNFNNNIYQNGPGDLTTSLNSPQMIYSIPEIYKTYWVRTNGYWVSVTRSRQEAVGMYSDSKMEYVLHLRIMTIKDAKVLYDLIDQARKVYMESQGKKIRIFTVEDGCYWRCSASCTKRPLSSVVLAKSLKDKVLSDTQEFLNSRSWYTDRGIPYRRGYLFYGKPGTGKTSFITALAGEFGLDIYNISLSSGVDNHKLADLVNQIPERALLLMEDIDAAFVDPVINRDQQEKKSNINERNFGNKGGLTLSGVLNIVDGVGAGEGRIMVATTNYYDRLDEALIRPGRIDLEVKFELASKYQAREQFCQFYVPTITKKEKEPEFALSPSLTTDKDKDGSPTTTTALAERYFEEKDLHDLDDLDFAARIDRLADQFVEDFPEYVISSASLQQYLLMHKSGPIEAVAKFKTWVQAEIERKERKGAALPVPVPVPVPELLPDAAPAKLPSDGSITDSD